MEIFLGRTVNTLLPNSGAKYLNMKRDVEGRKKMQVRWMDKLGRTSITDYKKGDLVRVQDQKTGVWNIKGEIDEVREVQEGGPKSYVVLGEAGGKYLRNGKFVKIRISKAKRRLRVTFSCSLLSQAGG